MYQVPARGHRPLNRVGGAGGQRPGHHRTRRKCYHFCFYHFMIPLSFCVLARPMDIGP